MDDVSEIKSVCVLFWQQEWHLIIIILLGFHLVDLRKNWLNLE